MSATTYDKPKQSSATGGGTPWTPEQKAAYLNTESAFAVYMRNRNPGERRWFPAVILEIGERHEVANTHPQATSKTRQVRTVKFELRGNQPVQLASGDVASPDGMRFQKDSADNPYNDKTILNAICRATVGEPDPKKPFTVNWQDLIGTAVEVEIEKQNPRTDGKRGGFYSELKDVRRLIVDDLPLAVVPNTPVGTIIPKAAAPAPAADEDDSQPWA